MISPLVARDERICSRKPFAGASTQLSRMKKAAQREECIGTRSVMIHWEKSAVTAASGSWHRGCLDRNCSNHV
jgi:hypothetical protein